jgi:hypothetical protein
MQLTDTQIKQLTRLLAHIYRSIDWRRIRTSKSRYDIWNHRVRAAAKRPTLAEFASRLCNFFGVQSLSPAAIALIETLQPHEHACLNYIDRNHIYIATKSAIMWKQLTQPEEQHENHHS